MEFESEQNRELAKKLWQDFVDLAKLSQQMLEDVRTRYDKEKEALDEEEKTSKTVEHGFFEHAYQVWYTGSCAVIREVIPERLTEFEKLYLPDPKRKRINEMTYTVQDWLSGVGIAFRLEILDLSYLECFTFMLMRFIRQLHILVSAQTRFGVPCSEILRQLEKKDPSD